MIIRAATEDDFEQLFSFGSMIVEFRVSADESFMDRDEFLLRITNNEDVFLLAELDSRIIGFILFGINDKDRLLKNKYACLVYLVVDADYRRKGIAGKLYDTALGLLHKKGITHIYSWANAESDNSMIRFLTKRKFAKGHQYMWMDRKI